MDAMSIIRAVVTVASLLCFLAWLVWFLKKDNHEYYQARAAELLEDDDTTPVVVNPKS
jgi:cbb3-type cytochrome oxidase subunit 3